METIAFFSAARIFRLRKVVVSSRWGSSLNKEGCLSYSVIFDSRTHGKACLFGEDVDLHLPFDETSELALECRGPA